MGFVAEILGRQQGIQWYYIIGMLIFIGLFVLILVRTFRMSKSDIANYKNAADKFDPTRSRRLLLTRAEINKLAGLSSQKGYVLVPLKLYASGSRLKLTVGYGKGRKKYDKRQLERQRDLKREEERELR